MSQAWSDSLESLLRKLTLEEKASLTVGADHWHTRALAAHGIAKVKLSDGPTGVRGSGQAPRQTSACFPCGIALGASWDVELLEALGNALAEEARSKGAQVVLGPTINLQRTPIGGRNFECYSEDPYLTGALAGAIVAGLQDAGIGACAKHFVCNDCEFERRSISSEVDERTLRELYLRPFEELMERAEPWLVMSAYNRVNGIYASCHPELLTKILKQEWGFSGVVVSDWGAATDTYSDARAGLDLEMPGPGRSLGARLYDAASRGEVSTALVDDKARRMLLLAARTGALQPGPLPEAPELVTETSLDLPHHRALARRAASEGLVLLQNPGQLPIDPSRIGSVALIGPLAARGPIQGGGSAFVHSHYETSLLSALRERLGPHCRVEHAEGCAIPHFAPAILVSELRTPSDEPGLAVEIWNGPAFEGEPAARATLDRAQAFFGRIPPEGIESAPFAVRYRGGFTPSRSGEYVFGLSATGRARLYVDGAECIDNWTDPTFVHDIFGAGQTTEQLGTRNLEAGRAYELVIEYLRPDSSSIATLRFGAHPPEVGDPMQEAVELARRSDLAILVVGTGREWETEGRDRESLGLPGPQNELIERVSAVQPNTAVILHTGGPITMPWLDRVRAVAAAWFPGQELGNALCDVLLGEVNPCGRLPITFPHRLEDAPSTPFYPGRAGELRYGEGLFAGYRGYDAHGIEPLFPFGHGLSFSTFDYTNLRRTGNLDRDSSLDVRCEIHNRGPYDGYEIAQLYVHSPKLRLVSPEQELRGFQKLWISNGQRAEARFSLSARAFAHWDSERHAWWVEAGTYELRIGRSSRDVAQSCAVRIERSFWLGS